MNCPGALLVYNNGLHSYKDLPLRIAELGQVHRHEASGALNGLFRVRTFTQDDAHIFVTPDQIESEVKDVLDLIDRMYGVFGMKSGIRAKKLLPMPAAMPAVTSRSTLVTVPSMDRSWTSTSRIPWDATGSAAPCSWT